MAIDKLSSASGIIAALRAELSQRAERPRKRASNWTESEGLFPAASRDVKVLRKQLAEIVRPVATRDRAAVRAVRPQVIRAILLWEFGPAFREHPEWQPMLESIAQNLDSRAPHEVQFARLISELQAE